MRFIVDVTPVEDRVEGTIASDGAVVARPFSGWLELLRLLEVNLDVPAAPPGPVPVDGLG